MAEMAGNDKEHLSGEQATEKVRALLQNFRSGMLTTVVAGEVHSRPMGMTGKPADFEGTLWFFSDDRSRKLREIQGDRTASVVFQNDDKSAFLHLAGRATETRDRAKMAELYTPILRTWFPQGLEDPHLTLIQFDAERGDYWDSPGGMLQVLAAFTKAVLTGTPGAGGNMGQMKLD